MAVAATEPRGLIPVAMPASLITRLRQVVPHGSRSALICQLLTAELDQIEQRQAAKPDPRERPRCRG